MTLSGPLQFLPRVLLVLLLVYLGFGLFLYMIQRSFIYMPIKATHEQHKNFELIKNDGETLKVWVISPGKQKAVIYFGGNAEDVFYNSGDFLSVLPDHTVYLVNYRGYGGSSGSPSETALFSDALAIFDTVKPRHTQLSVIGRSLGSSISTYLASQRNIDKLLLITPYDSVLNIANNLYPLYPVKWLLKDHYESSKFASMISSPVLILTAGNDRIIPPKHSQSLFKAFKPGIADYRVIQEAGHNNISAYNSYWGNISEFLDH